MTPTPEVLAVAKKVDDEWRAANGWPGMVWPDGPGPYSQPDRWPHALEDRVMRIALALTEQAREIERLKRAGDEMREAFIRHVYGSDATMDAPRHPSLLKVVRVWDAAQRGVR